jgi:hypothetical protein
VQLKKETTDRTFPVNGEHGVSSGPDFENEQKVRYVYLKHGLGRFLKKGAINQKDTDAD